MKVLLVGNGINLNNLPNNKRKKLLYSTVFDEFGEKLLHEIINRGIIKANTLWSYLIKDAYLEETAKNEAFALSVKFFEPNINSVSKEERVFLKAYFKYFLSFPSYDLYNYEALSNLIGLSKQTEWLNGINTFAEKLEKAAENKIKKMFACQKWRNKSINYSLKTKNQLKEYKTIFTTNFDSWIEQNLPEGKKVIHLHGSVLKKDKLSFGSLDRKMEARKILNNFFLESPEPIEVDVFGMSMISDIHIVDALLQACYSKKILKIKHFLKDENHEESPSNILSIAKKYVSKIDMKSRKHELALLRLEKVYETKNSENWEYENYDTNKMIYGAKWSKKDLK